MSKFAELLKALNTMADEQDKEAQAAAAGKDDKTIQAAAADSGVTPPPAAGDGDVNPEDEIDDADVDGAPAAAAPAGDDKDAPPMTKSLGVDEHGNEMLDATELLKSLQATQTEQGEALTKAMETVLQMNKAQSELIKSMQTRLDELAGQGRGRKTIVAINEKPDAATLAKSGNAHAAPAVVKPGEVLAKCLAAQKSGALSGHDVARAEIALNNGLGVPADILSRIN